MRLLRRIWPLLFATTFILVVGSCTASQPPTSSAGPGNQLPGFWMGFWHGFIASISFVVSLFTDEVRIYAFPNTGRWYDFGFMLGIGGFSGGVLAGSRHQSRGRQP